MEIQNSNPTILSAAELPSRLRPVEQKNDISLLGATAFDTLLDAAADSSSGSGEDDEDDDLVEEPIDEQEIYDLISTISDPEHPLSLGSLAVVNLPDIRITRTLPDAPSSPLRTVTVLITPTITHCSLATVIGLGVRVRLEQALPPRFRVDVRIKEGTHSTAAEVTKQLRDKERVAAALENATLMGVIGKMLETWREMSNSGSGADTPVSRFTAQTASAEDLLKSHTVGLVHLSDFRKRRAEVLEQKEKEAHAQNLLGIGGGGGGDGSRDGTPHGDRDRPTQQSDAQSGGESSGRPQKKKKKHVAAKARLSYADDDDGEEEAAPTPQKAKAAPTTDSTEPSASPLPARRIRANPNVSLPPPKLLTKSALTAEARARDALRREFLALQERVKNTEIAIPFVFYDGTNIPAGTVRVKKGDPVWLFLDRCRKVGATLGVGGGKGRGKGRKEYRREWARIGVDDLLLVRGGVIIPHHYEFYYFIANRVPDFSGRPGTLLFDYTDTAPAPSASAAGSAGLSATGEKQGLSAAKSVGGSAALSASATEKDDSALEGASADPALTKVVDRRWYERNKHIYPASLWREYEPGEQFEESMTGIRRDNMGNAFFF
ncbi:hypothetical protein KEM52_000445 [Ascosphaera acerosa]|nr:hypothetical protein KEM52_000445 [Ascosphaera acerosa]